MTRLGNFFRFWYGFVVGDDWVIAAGVVIALIVTGLLAQRDTGGWWVMPVAVAVLLAVSIWRETRRSDWRSGQSAHGTFMKRTTR